MDNNRIRIVFAYYSLNSLSLFAEKKIIEVRLNQAKQPEKAAAALAAMSSAGDDILVLLSMPRADGNVQKAKWFKALEGVGAVIQVWPVAPKDLPRWIEQRLRQQGVRIKFFNYQIHWVNFNYRFNQFFFVFINQF